MDMYTLLYLEWITNKDLLCGTWNLAQCYVVAWMGGVLGREWMCVCVSLKVDDVTTWFCKLVGMTW